MTLKLTDRHIGLPPFLAMSVDLAAHVLSHSGAAGIATLVTLKHLPKSVISLLSLLNTLMLCFMHLTVKYQKMHKGLAMP